MKILVFGNIGAGKTSLINRLNEFYHWEILAIDNFRRRYGDGSKEKEKIAQQQFFRSIKPNHDQFIECIGVGKVSEKLSKYLKRFKELFICIKIITPKEICKNRLLSRNWDIPFPKPLKEVDPLIDKTEERFRNGLAEELWGKRNNTVIITKEYTLLDDINKLVEEINSQADNY